MRAKLHRLESDIRFWVWKAQALHVGRYIALITIIAVVVGVTDYSLNLSVPVAKAANTASVNYSTNVLNIDGGHYLLDQNRCLWSMDVNASITVTDQSGANSYPNFKGKTCLTDSSGSAIKPDVTITNNGILEVMGQGTTFKSLTVSNGGKMTTPPADANAKSAPYATRDVTETVRFTGFVKLDAPASDKRTYILSPYFANGLFGQKVYTTTYIALAPNDTNVDDAKTNADWSKPNNYIFSVSDCRNADPSFFSGICPVDGRAGLLDGSREKASLSVDVKAGQTLYVPIEIISTRTTNAFGNIAVDYQALDGSGIVVEGGSSTQLPLARVYPPVQDASPAAGTVDTSVTQQMRLEFGNDAPGSTSIFVRRDLSNAPVYGFFSRVNLDSNGTLNGWNSNGPAVSGNSFFINGPIFANNAAANGLDYLLGGNGATSQDVNMQRNYKLEDHDDTSTGETAGLNLSVQNDITLNTGSIDVSGRGLPGGDNLLPASPNDRGYSGIGGHGATSNPGWEISHIDGDVNPGGAGSDYDGSTGNGGGGGPGTKTPHHVGLGGGGGGVGYGAGARTMVTIDGGNSFFPNLNSDGKTGFLNCDDGAWCYRGMGHGGGGFLGVGGQFPSSDLHEGNPGTSQRTTQYASNSKVALGGGGAQGSCGLANDDALDLPADASGWANGSDQATFCTKPAGNGGGLIKLSVGGAINVSNNSNIAADGSNGYYSGGGGGGTVDITATKTFTLPNTAHIEAKGGSVTAACGHETNANPSYFGCGTPGEGGGGLVRIRAASYSGAGWPATFCSVVNPNTTIYTPFPLSTPFTNMSVSNGSVKYVVNGNTTTAISDYSEPGIIDMDICNTISTALTISKQIQQLNSNVTWSDSNYGAIVSKDADWSNVSTAIPNSHIRVVLTIVNTTADSSSPATITDVLPVQGMTIGVSGLALNSAVLTTNAAANPTTTQSGDVLTMSNLKMNKNTTVRIVYSGVLPNPF